MGDATGHAAGPVRAQPHQLTTQLTDLASPGPGPDPQPSLAARLGAGQPAARGQRHPRRVGVYHRDHWPSLPAPVQRGLLDRPAGKGELVLEPAPAVAFAATVAAHRVHDGRSDTMNTNSRCQPLARPATSGFVFTLASHTNGGTDRPTCR